MRDDGPMGGMKLHCEVHGRGSAGEFRGRRPPLESHGVDRGPRNYFDGCRIKRNASEYDFRPGASLSDDANRAGGIPLSSPLEGVRPRRPEFSRYFNDLLVAGRVLAATV
jgi:hypothetical protein